jgi:hypothetical protein
MKTYVKMLIMAMVYLNAGLSDLYSQQTYTDYKGILQKAVSVAKENPSICTLQTLVKTDGGKEILVLTIGKGDKDNKPGIAVVGGIDGSYILGRELAIGFAEKLIRESQSQEVMSLLDKVTFYIFPDVSPDASEQYFSELRYERSINARQTDDDRDFSNDEDPYEDMNGDRMITLIRVTDPAGTYAESTEDKRIMVQADLSKGETGRYLVYSEGTDNDKDGSFNEDGPGGVSFNRNLTYNYEEFGLNAGLHPVSEPEVKAVLDFLFSHFNIYTTVAYGPQDNLGQPMRASERQDAAQYPAQQQGMTQGMPQGTPQGVTQSRNTGQPRKITSITREDEKINKLVSDKYHEITGIKGAPIVKNTPGNFMEWAYFHYGRYSFSSPAWWFTVEKDKNPEAAFLKYAELNKIENVFVPWIEIRHPDFQNKKVETGGIKPFATTTPPAEMLPELIINNFKFLTAIASMHPDLEFLDVIVENKGDEIFRLTLKVHNKGVFATCAEAGENNMWTRIMRISLDIAKNQKFLSGQKVQRIQRLEGGESAEFSWLISGKGSLKVTAGAVNTGIITTSAELK